jgi:acyl dehydratase/NADP-dependent 3-hydroxy acid dehydrogenase YdfG
MKISSRIVDAGLHERFAALSGDRNPMHMDPVAARRTQAGQPVVHGIHTLLWVLDSLAACNQMQRPPTQIKAKFLKWVYLGDEATLSATAAADGSRIAFEVNVIGMTVVAGELLFSAELPELPAAELKPIGKPLEQAIELTFSELEGRRGDAFVAAPEVAATLFPALAKHVGGAAMAELAACSYVIGMEVPGLHSMFSRLDLHLRPPAPGAPGALHFAVSYTDERFRKLRVEVTGTAIHGQLEAFVRQPPARQATFAETAACVQPGEFVGMNALIVGGSRGLGEFTAKLIAGGGGVPTITFALGRSEAEAVAAELREHGAEAHTLKYDVREAPGPQLEVASRPFTHMFYFATNAIFRPKGPLVSTPYLVDFMRFYVHGFYDLCMQLIAGRTAKDKLIVYYPSSIAVEERPEGMTEYAMVKAAGEQMCRDMNKYLPAIEIVTTRLPRLATDQTASVLPGRELKAIDVLLPIVRTMQAAGRNSA